MLPTLTGVNRPFWTGGANGRLLIQHCVTCARWVHPPQVACPDCGGPLVVEAVSGDGSVFTFTINEQPYHPDVAPPYVIAIVVLDEQDDLRLATNLVRCDVDAIRIGMPVCVLFERHDELYVPVFEPA